MLLFILILFVFCLIIVAIYYSVMAHKNPPRTGAEGLIGSTGKSISDITTEGGRVFLKGEIWRAESDNKIKKDKKIKVIDVKDDLTLSVMEDL